MYEDEEDGDDFSDMSYSDFMKWLYENRSELFDFDIEEVSTEIDATMHININARIGGKVHTIADQYGPFIAHRN